MGVVTRGVKNAFRSGIRTAAVVLILAISMGLALSMLLANEAIKARLSDLKQNVGTAIAITPAGSKGFQGGGEPLTVGGVQEVSNLPYVKELNMNLSLLLLPEDSAGLGARAMGPSGIEAGATNLESSIDAGTLGKRMQGRDNAQSPPKDVKVPVRMIGIAGSRDDMGKSFTIVEGRALESEDTNNALVGKSLALKNNLAVGSTFTAYGETFTVIGIFDADTNFANDALYVPLSQAQKLGDAGDEITSATAIIDSIDNVTQAVTGIKGVLGDRADVSASEEGASTAVESLKSVEKVSIIGFSIALAAAGVIIFLTMLMIVRERRREIGVLKAIGASNRSIVTQFVVEAIVLVALGSLLGFGIAAASSNSIAGALVNSSSNTSQADQNTSETANSFRSVQVKMGNNQGASAKDLIGNVTTNVSVKSLGYGLLAAIGIAIVGSAIPAWFITKVRPAEVLRGE